MGLNLTIITEQFANQFNNGETLDGNLIPTNTTTYLSGNSGELLKNTINFSISWSSESSLTDVFSVNANTLTRSGSGDFTDDGFKLGDVIDIWELTPLGVVVSDRIITLLTPSQIDFDGASVGSSVLTDGKVYGKTPLENIIFNYGLIENAEGINFISKVDGTAENEFFASGVGLDLGGGVRDTSIIPMIKATGVNSWKDDGSGTIGYISTGNQTDDFKQTFDIVHIFRLFPFYLDGWLPNLQTLAPPFPEWQSTNCLKYVSKIEMRQAMNNPNSSRSNEFSAIQGNTGWLDENFNGFTNNFSVQSIDIISNTSGQPLVSLDYQDSCHVTVVLFSNNGVFLGDGTKVLGCISYLPPQLNYQQNLNDISQNFLFDSVYTTISEPPKTSSIIQNFDITSSTGATCTVEFDVIYTPSQQSLLQNQKYVILMGTGDPLLLSPSSDRVMMLAQLEDFYFNLDVPNLMFVDEFKFVPHDENDYSGNLPNDYKGWIEDGFQIQAPFKLNTDAGAFLNNLSVDIVAFNSDTFAEFTLQTTNIDLTGAVVSLGIQQINVNNINNFLIDSTSDFRKIDCVNLGSSTHGGFNVELYDTKVGVRFNFEEWIALLTANSQYFDATQLNNGLNLLTSNYSTGVIFPIPDNYQIKAKLNASVNDGTGVLTNYMFLSNDLKAYYYDLDETKIPHWICNIETFDTSGVLIDVILSDTFTDIKATFTKNPLSLPTPPDIVSGWGWIRLDIQQGTINTPYQISTIYTPISSSPLIPLPTETRCKITNSGNMVILESRIDNNFIPTGSILSISARLSDELTVGVQSWQIRECEGEPFPQEYFTSTDLTAYIGTTIFIDTYAQCWEVIGLDTKAPDYPNEPIVVLNSFTGEDSCSDCYDSIKQTESGGIKLEENTTIKIIE